jgi:hypothetical protein
MAKKTKTASSKSKFDFQKLLLERGEKIGLIIAGICCVLLILFGIMAAAGAANPSRLTTEIKSGIASIDNQLQKTPDKKPPEVEVPDKNSKFVVVKATDFPTPYEWFNTSGTISEKRNNPPILALTEGVARYQIGGFGVVMIQNDQVAVVVGRQAPAQNRPLDILRKSGQNKNKGGAPNPGQPGPATPTQPPAAPGMAKGGGGRPGSNPGLGKASEAEIIYMPLDSKDVESAQFAINLRPVRMARIQGIVPYKDQVAKHMRALRLDTDNALTAERMEPIYRGFNVERLKLDAEGKKVIQDWTPFDHVEAMKSFQEPAPGTKLLFAAYENTDELKVFIPEPVHRLFMKAPLLAHGTYETVQLNELGRAMQELAKTGQPKDLTGKSKSLKEGDDPFDPPNLVTPGQVGGGGAGPAIRGGNPAIGGGGPPVGGGAGRGGILGKGGEARPGPATTRTNAAPVWLLQFIDPTIEAGYCYKYRIQLKAENPNFGKPDTVSFAGLANQRELLSDWFEIPDVVFAQPEEHLYAHGEKHKERPLYGTADYDTTIIKYHRWFDYVRVTRDGGIPDPIGEWVIVDLLAKRGQYIQEKEKNFRMPLWSMVANAYAFRDLISNVGTNANKRKGENVKMDFSPLTPVLLVDFSGGAGSYRAPKGEPVKDVCAGEILIITDDGKTMKVSAQNTVDDSPEKAENGRMAREKAWEKWLVDVWNGTDKPANPTGPTAPGKGGAG